MAFNPPYDPPTPAGTRSSSILSQPASVVRSHPTTTTRSGQTTLRHSSEPFPDGPLTPIDHPDPRQREIYRMREEDQRDLLRGIGGPITRCLWRRLQATYGSQLGGTNIDDPMALELQLLSQSAPSPTSLSPSPSPSLSRPQSRPPSRPQPRAGSRPKRGRSEDENAPLTEPGPVTKRIRPEEDATLTKPGPSTKRGRSEDEDAPLAEPGPSTKRIRRGGMISSPLRNNVVMEDSRPQPSPRPPDSQSTSSSRRSRQSLSSNSSNRS